MTVSLFYCIMHKKCLGYFLGSSPDVPNGGTFSSLPFWAAAPKGVMPYTRGGDYVHTHACPSPPSKAFEAASQASRASSQVFGTLSQVSRASSQASGASSQASGVSSQASGVSSQASGVFSLTSETSSKASRDSRQTLITSNQAFGSL